MSRKIDLKRLSKLSAPHRVFLSVYVTGADRKWLERRIAKSRAVLSGSKAELEHLDANVQSLLEHIGKKGLRRKTTCFFVCWALDLIESHELAVSVENKFIVDSSPYIRPVAELQDEYETFAVVAADNSRAKISLVCSAAVREESRVRGNIKNHVKVGGWSQQRYERRRDKQIARYSKEIAERLAELERTEKFRRLILVGSKEAVGAIREQLPQRLARKVVGSKAVHLAKGPAWVEKEVYDLFFKAERKSERDLWTRIRSEFLRGGLAAMGPEAVQEAAARGRVESMIVASGLKLPGVRCPQCENLFAGKPGTCSACGSDWLFGVDLIEEIVELVAASGGDTDFADPIPGLSEGGGVAALLRY